MQFIYDHPGKYVFTGNFDFCYGFVKQISQSLYFKTKRNQICL